MNHNKARRGLSLRCLLVVLQLFVVNSPFFVNSAYLGYGADSQIKHIPSCSYLDYEGDYNWGKPFLHLFESYDAQMLVTLDSPTYRFSSYLNNEAEMTDQEVVRYSKNGITFKSKGYMRPVYKNKYANDWGHGIEVKGDEQEIILLGYFSSVCLPGMAPVCLDTAGRNFYVPSITNNYQLNCHNPNTHFGDQEWADYSIPYCKIRPGDKWAGFTYVMNQANSPLAMEDIEILKRTEYSQPAKVVKKFVNTSPNEVSYTYESAVQVGNSRVNRESMSHEWSVNVKVEHEIGNAFTPVKTTMSVEVGYSGSLSKEQETQSSVTTTNTETLSINLAPNTSVTIKQTAAFEQQKIRAKVCHPPFNILKPWFGSTPYIIGHTTSKSLNLQQTSTPHLISGQLCFLGEFELETNTYVSVQLDK